MATTADPRSEGQTRLAALLAAQGVRPIENPETLIFPEWPEDESADDFIAAVREWRREGLDPA